MKTDTFRLIMDIMRGRWLVADPDALLPAARAVLNRLPVEMEKTAAEVAKVADPGSQGGDAGWVAIVPLHGTMTKYDTCLSYGTKTIADKIREMTDSGDVAGIVLDIDSPGGCSSAIPPMLEAITYAKAHGKPVYAHVDLCASAAYWVASQCDAIYMDNDLSEVGSIGAMAVFVDCSAPNPQTGERTLTIYPDESSDKNRAYRDALEGNFETVKAELRPLVERFREAVVSGRPNIRKDENGVLSGAMFGVGDAIRLNMADAKKTLSETIDAVFAITSV